MRHASVPLGIVLIAISTSPLLAQPPPTQPPVTARPAPKPAKPPFVGSTLYSPTTRAGERPIASGFDGLRTPVNRATYRQRGSAQPIPVYPATYRGDASFNPSARSEAIGRGSAGPTMIYSTAGKVTGDDPGGKANRYQVYAYLNENGGRTSVIYDAARGTSRSVNESVSFGQIYYGPSSPGSLPQHSPVGVSYGNGMGSNSGNILGPSFGNGGPYGNGGSIGIPQSATTPSVIVPTYGVTQP